MLRRHSKCKNATTIAPLNWCLKAERTNTWPNRSRFVTLISQCAVKCRSDILNMSLKICQICIRMDTNNLNETKTVPSQTTLIYFPFFKITNILHW